MSYDTTQHRWLKEIAYAFGMSIDKFAETIGYSRQTLYCASYGSCKLSKERFGLALFKLAVVSKNVLENDIRLAEERYEHRRKMINEFAKRLGVGDE